MTKLWTEITGRFKSRMLVDTNYRHVSHKIEVDSTNIQPFSFGRWYLPNYAVAEHLAWGAKRGCTFVTKSCYSYMVEQQSR